MATHIRCFKCRHIFDIKEMACPECGQVRRAFSSHLYRSMLDNDLYRKAEAADHTRAQFDHIRRGGQIPPTAAQKRQARQIVADM